MFIIKRTSPDYFFEKLASIVIQAHLHKDLLKKFKLFNSRPSKFI